MKRIRLGRTSSLAELPIQYADFAAWQREWLQGEVLAELLEYGAWSGLVHRQCWSCRRIECDDAEVQRGAHLAMQLPAELTTDFKPLSHREDVTLFMTLLAGWQFLLPRYSRQADMLVGTPVAGRTRSESKG